MIRNILLIAATLSTPAVATTAAVRNLLAEPSTLFIETIAVEGASQASPEIVISESRLEADRAYTEDELWEAIDRIHRLPFILDAGLALERGSERGKLRLVITVAEVSRFFVGGEVVATRFGRDLALGDAIPASSEIGLAPIAGARFFVGDYGVLFAAAGNGRSIQAGYTRYRLFGRQGLLHIGVERSACCPVTVLPLGLDPTFSSWSTHDTNRATLTLGVPLRARDQSLRLTVSGAESASGQRQPVLASEAGSPAAFEPRDLTDRKLELRWISDTSDDPAFPTRGKTWTAALEQREISADFAPLLPAVVGR